MRVFVTAPRRGAGRQCRLASIALTSTALGLSGWPLASPPALAQQTASPDMTLPEVKVSPPKPRPRRKAQPKRAAPEPAPGPAPAPASDTAVVVSPTATPTASASAASSVTVITAEDLQREQRRTLPDALSAVGGLNIVQSGGPGAVTSVFMRGTNSNHTKVLIDGTDVSDPSNPGRVFDLGQMLTDDIERVEVLRGPQSGLYGADAIGGVISIITKKGEGPPKVTAATEGGSFGTFNQYGSLSGSQDRFNYAFNIQHWRSTSTPVTPLELVPPGQKRNDDLYDNATYSTKLGYDLSDDVTLNQVARYTQAILKFTGDTFDPGLNAVVPAPLRTLQVVHQLYSRSEAVWSLFDGRVKNYFGVNYTNSWNWNEQPDLLADISKGDRVRFDWNSVITAIPGQTFLVGLQHEKETLHDDSQSSPPRNLVDADTATKSGYAQAQLSYSKMAFLVANVRYDDNADFGAHTTYRLAPAFVVPEIDTKFKASYGTGFKAPTLSQLFVSFPAFFFFANPDLKPEESKGWDAGFEQPLFTDRVRFGATYFHNDIKNLIQSAPLPSPQIGTTLTNVGVATTSGWETFAQAAITERLSLRADYTFTTAIDDATGLELPRRPRQKFSLQAIWNPTDVLTLSATLVHVGSWIDGSRDFSIPRLTAPGHTVVNVAGSYKIDDNITAFARVDNLFNEHYQDPFGFLRPGIGIFGGVRYAGSPLPFLDQRR